MLVKFIVIILSLLVCSCTTVSLTLVNTLARMSSYQVYQDLSYGEHQLNSLDVYVPEEILKDSQSAFPVVVFFYGGCWGGCETRSKEDYVFVAQALTEHGYIAVLADYRLYPEVKFKQIMNDAAHSVEWVKDNIAQHGGDADSIFLMGHSAGAHLAAMLVLDESYLNKQSYQSIKGLVGLAGPYDFLPFTKEYQKALFGPKESYLLSQPINFVEGTEPPLLLLYGNEDEVVFPRNIKNLTAKVKQLGGQVEAKIYNDIDHFSILGALSIPYQQKTAILGDIIQFLDHYTDHSMLKKVDNSH